MNSQLRTQLIHAFLFSMCIVTLLLMGAEDRRQEILAYCHHNPQVAECQEPLPESFFDLFFPVTFSKEPQHGTPSKRN